MWGSTALDSTHKVLLGEVEANGSHLRGESQLSTGERQSFLFGVRNLAS